MACVEYYKMETLQKRPLNSSIFEPKDQLWLSHLFCPNKILLDLSWILACDLYATQLSKRKMCGWNWWMNSKVSWKQWLFETHSSSRTECWSNLRRPLASASCWFRFNYQSLSTSTQLADLLFHDQSAGWIITHSLEGKLWIHLGKSIYQFYKQTYTWVVRRS